jgi:hypothetical protein
VADCGIGLRKDGKQAKEAKGFESGDWETGQNED